MVGFFQRAERNIRFFQYRFQYLIRYIFIGFFSVFLETALVHYFLSVGASAPISITIGFMSGLLLSFILNARLNFHVPKEKNLQTFVLFSAISIASFFANLLLIALWSNSTTLNYGFSRFITAGAIFLISYALHRRFTFSFVKRVGIAVYLTSNTSVSRTYRKIRYYSDFIHLDLIDKTFDSDAKEVDLSSLKAVGRTWGLKKMIHIMSKNPKKWIQKVHPYVHTILFHYEMDEDITQCIRLCKEYGKEVGVVLSLETPLSKIEPYLGDLDYVQIMGIAHLGHSGEPLRVESLQKLRDLRSLQRRHSFKTVFDGGVKATNVGRIPAEYIVAGSGLLSADDPVQSFLEIKTSSRYRDIREELRKEIIQVIRSTTRSLDFVRSGTLVGSFAESQSLEGISDIDVILILDSLTPKKFSEVVAAFSEKGSQLESKYGYPVILNTTFGPLKFHGENIVFHLMIYDEKGHRDHCQKSPFTCLDWQRSPFFIKEPLSEIYRVRALQPSLFFRGRRSAEEYLRELKLGKISYREYVPKGKKLVEEKKYLEMGDRERVEFAYHIIKFIMINCIKLHKRKNVSLDWPTLQKEYFLLFPERKEVHQKFIQDIVSRKNTQDYTRTSHLLSSVDCFLQDFEKQFQHRFYRQSTRVVFFRHGKTNLNKEGMFLGQRQDPEIIPGQQREHISPDLLTQAEEIYASPSRRCMQTLRELGVESPLSDSRLKEIDYGRVDGKDYDYLLKHHPQIIERWEFGEDPSFPGGENYRAVISRVKPFIEDCHRSSSRKIIACTHNVVLRTLVGSLLTIPSKDWHKIDIPHCYPITILITPEGVPYLDMAPEKLEVLLHKFPHG